LLGLKVAKLDEAVGPFTGCRLGQAGGAFECAQRPEVDFLYIEPLKTTTRIIHMKQIRLLAGAIFIGLLCSAANAAPNYIFSTVAGEAGYGYVNGSLTNARFFRLQGITRDAAGNLYVTEGTEADGNETIRKITPSGVVSTLAGNPLRLGHADGVGTNAQFWWPSSIVADPQGTLYVTDTRSELIRQITPDGTVRTIAGRFDTSGVNDGPGLSAVFNTPEGITRDPAGNLYLMDLTSSTIRKLSPAGDGWNVSTLAGNGPGSSDGTGTAAHFMFPSAVVADTVGNLYVADTMNFAVRKVAPGGVVTTFAGILYASGYVDGTGSAARFSSLNTIAIDTQGNLYVGEGTRIRKITPGAVVTTLAGSGGFGWIDGSGTNARFGSITGIVTDDAGNLYVADSDNNAIRKVTPAGVVTTITGAGPLTGGYHDGANGSARFYTPHDVLLGRDGNYYITDGSHTIRKMTPAGVVSTFAGLGLYAGTTDGTGSSARFYDPRGLALDSAGNLFVADTGNSTIRKITPAGVVTTIAGRAGSVGTADGATNNARFNHPEGVAVDAGGTVYVADTANYTIRKISGGTVTTIAGAAGVWGTVDGTNTSANFKNPCRIICDGAGNLLVTDFQGYRVRKVRPQGTNWIVTTFAGRSIGTQDGYADMTRYPRASFENISGMSFDTAGNLYVADTIANTIRRVSNEGTNSWVLTVGGLADFHGSVDGTFGLFFQPEGVAVDAAGNLYIADTMNNTIRKATLVVPPPTLQALLIPGDIVLSWPVSLTGYVAEACLGLGSSWQPLTNAVLSGGNWVSTNATVGPSGFYRLRGP
jgi:sugar lactone lactonase YvrE